MVSGRGEGGGVAKRKEKLITCVIITQFLLCFFLLCFERSLSTFPQLASLKCRLPLPRPRLCHRPSVVGAVAKLKYHKFELITVE